jgi:hypothetical protein
VPSVNPFTRAPTDALVPRGPHLRRDLRRDAILSAILNRNAGRETPPGEPSSRRADAIPPHPGGVRDDARRDERDPQGARHAGREHRSATAPSRSGGAPRRSAPTTTSTWRPSSATGRSGRSTTCIVDGTKKLSTIASASRADREPRQRHLHSHRGTGDSRAFPSIRGLGASDDVYDHGRRSPRRQAGARRDRCRSDVRAPAG